MMRSLLVLSTLLAPASAQTCEMTPARLRVNNLDSPLGVAAKDPRLSWALEAASSPPARGLVQTAYRIEASSKMGAAADIWDSGKITSADTLEILFGGKGLKPSTAVHWKVTTWHAGAPAAGCASAPAVFETALAAGEAGWAGSDWLARYSQAPLNASSCALYADNTERTQAPRFRAEVTVPSITSARAYIVGLGYYQLYIDGKRIGTSRLDPGWTTYSKHVLYAVYDVTAELSGASGQAAGKHAVGVELGNGWWNPMTLKMWGHTDVRGALTVGQGRGNGTTTEPMFRLKIVATMSDGSQKTILTSTAAEWEAGGSPTTFNNIYLGERYDARMEDAGNALAWATIGYDTSSSSWSKAVVAGDDASLSLGVLEPQAVPPIRRQGVLKTTVVAKHSPTALGALNATIILDTGKNHAGVCRFKLQGSAENAGQKVVMRYGELLNADGVSLNPMTSVAGQIKGPTENLCVENPGRSLETGLHVAFQADELTLSGRETPDDWTPSYSWHGFRFVELTVPLGMTIGPDTAGAVECYPMRTDVDIVANFTSSDPFLSDLRTLNRNTFDSNLMSVQSDCPHRERFGYGGDPLGCGEAGLSIYDWSTFYAKRVRDFNDAQSVDPATGKPAAFPETSPFVGIRCGGCGADGGFKGDLPAFPGAGGPIGWQTYQPVTQLWLYKYYGDMQTMVDSFDQTYA
jgi:alpha-L-rhamnosidase